MLLSALNVSLSSTRNCRGALSPATGNPGIENWDILGLAKYDAPDCDSDLPSSEP